MSQIGPNLDGKAKISFEGQSNHFSSKVYTMGINFTNDISISTNYDVQQKIKYTFKSQKQYLSSGYLDLFFDPPTSFYRYWPGSLYLFFLNISSLIHQHPYQECWNLLMSRGQDQKWEAKNRNFKDKFLFSNNFGEILAKGGGGGTQ